MGQSRNSSQNHMAREQTGAEAEKVCKQPDHKGLILPYQRKKRHVLGSDHLHVLRYL